jgi:glycosyltransferase involved in cell wall biosynthesis
MRRVAVIIPAKDEEGRIGVVLDAALQCKYASEVIVVDDGSTDRTAEIAGRYPGVKVVRLPQNVGKGGAMWIGAKSTDAPLLAFVDADLGGLHPEHLDRIILPLLRNDCDMCVGIFKGGKVWSDAAQRVSPYLSGQRALKRELFESVPYMSDLRMGAEVALNSAAKRRKARVLRVILRGVYNCHKEQKLGLVKGTAARFKMFGEIGQAMVKTRRRRRGPATWRWPKH